MQRILIILIISVGMLGGCVTWRNNYAEGIKCFQVQDYRQAFIRLMPEALKGNPEAEYAVGYMFYYGQGVVEDRKKAWYWINCAAKKGQPDAVAAIRILKPAFSG